MPLRPSPFAILIAATLSSTLALAEDASTSKQNPASRWRVHAGITSEALRGNLLQVADGVRTDLAADDAFDRSDRQMLGISYQFDAHQELHLELGLDRARGKTVSLGAINGLAQAAELSRFEAVRYELGYRYRLTDPAQSGFFVGAQIGRERHNAVAARLSNGRTVKVFERGSGLSFGLNGGYEWRFGEHAALSVSLAMNQRPGFDVANDASALGIVRSKETDGPRSAALALRFSYAF